MTGRPVRPGGEADPMLAGKGPEAVLMSLDALEAFPVDFHDYAAQHPEILPDYRPEANDLVDLIDRRPDEVIVIEGPAGIGKTTFLMPSLLEAAKSRGYKPLGSVSAIMTDTENTDVLLDSHNWMKRTPSLNGIFPDQTSDRRISPGSDSQRSIFTREIRSRFASGTGRGLFLIDEAPLVINMLPWLVRFLKQEAKQEEVRLAFVQPACDGFDVPFGQRAYSNLTNHLAQSVVGVHVPGHPIEAEHISPLLEVLGVDSTLAETFEQNPNLRRIRVAEFIVNSFIRQRKLSDNDNTVWDKEKVAKVLAKVFTDTPENYGNLGTILGLSRDEFGKVSKDLTG